jgi:DNA-binding NtrC family response regulator
VEGLEPVLVVDDDPLVREMLVMMLESLGCKEIHEAGEPDAAWKLTETAGAPFELAVVDLTLRSASGGDFALSFHQRFPNSKILLISGDSDRLNRGITPKPEANIDVLSKPFTFTQLSDHLAHLASHN